MKNAVATSSYWTDSASIPRYSPLDRDLEVDVVVIGAGITGLTAAYLLKRAGRRVAVLERRRVGGVDTMATTAHVTCVTDLDLVELVKTFRPRSRAGRVGRRAWPAIAQIDDHRQRRGDRLRLEPGATASSTWRSAADAHDDVNASEEARARPRARFRCRVRRRRAVRRTGPALSFANQAPFHPAQVPSPRSRGASSTATARTCSSTRPCDEVGRRAARRSRPAATPSPAITSCWRRTRR